MLTVRAMTARRESVSESDTPAAHSDGLVSSGGLLPSDPALTLQTAQIGFALTEIDVFEVIR